MGMGQTDMSAFFAQVSDIEPEKGQDFVDVAIVDQTETMKFGQARFGFSVLEVADPVVRDEECWIIFLFGNLLADLRDPADGQMQSLALRPQAFTRFETERRSQHRERLTLALRYGRPKSGPLSSMNESCSENRHSAMWSTSRLTP